MFLVITDILRQIGQFQFFTAYNSQSCVFEPKSPFDVWFDWKVLFQVFTSPEPKTVFVSHKSTFHVKLKDADPSLYKHSFA